MRYRKAGDRNSIRTRSDLYWKAGYWGMRFYYDLPIPFGAAIVVANRVTCVIGVSTSTVKEMGSFDDRAIWATIAGVPREGLAKVIALPSAGTEAVDTGLAKTYIPVLRKSLDELTNSYARDEAAGEAPRGYRWARKRRDPAYPWIKSLTSQVETAVLELPATDFRIPNSSHSSAIYATVRVLGTDTSFHLGTYVPGEHLLYSFSPRIEQKLLEVVTSSERTVLHKRTVDTSTLDTEIFGWNIYEHLLAERRRSSRKLPDHLLRVLPADIADAITHSWSAYSRLDLPQEVLAYLNEREPEPSRESCYLCSTDSPLTSLCLDCADEVNHGLPIRDGREWSQSMLWGIEQLSIEFGGAMSRRQLWLYDLPEATPEAARKAVSRMVALQGEISWSKRIAGIVSGYRPSWGTYSIASDGHFCRSMFERVIDDYMSANKIEHSTEPSYPVDRELNPNGLLRADWLLADGTFVEAFGALENADYAAKAAKKRRLAKAHGIPLVEITPKDTNRLGELLGPRAESQR